MFGRSSHGGSASVTTLREVTNLAFLHRERVRFRAGRSELLGLALEPVPGEGFVVDVTGIADLRSVVVAASGSATIGAFAQVEQLARAVPAVCPPDATRANARMRLALHDARVTLYGLGRTRVAPLDGLAVAPHELPVSIDLPLPRPGLGIAERRLRTNDDDASFTVGVTVALRVSVLGRFENVRIFVDVDGDVRRVANAEATLEKQRCDRDLFPEAARMAAAAVHASDARSSSVARALLPLTLAALRDAFEGARRPKPAN